ncbi:hypothetical protein Pyrde_0867 [Pyrodictium delaneyi]|uniref:Uncharacterized protein n=2 Tax=Pyrodictium delaneyi TaxID=1273541 RepID=A0A0P0N3G8_9CREN|nr:hypothetical protein Pyrde_0867 [Pyrodictium delaneyi]OWJ55465.1 hypothetical protein Pdsh_01315 [Pyrodictium delaneyi]
MLLSAAEGYVIGGERYYCVVESQLPFLGISVDEMESLPGARSVCCWEGGVCGDCVESLWPPIYVARCVGARGLEELIASSCIQGGLKGVSRQEHVLERCVVFLRLLSALFKMRINNEVMFKRILEGLLRITLPDCIVGVESHPRFDVSRVDIFIECRDAAVAIDIKSPKDIRDTPAKSTPDQIAKTFMHLRESYQWERKPVAFIVIPTNGQPIPYFYGIGEREKGYIHLLTLLTIPGLEKYCKKMEREQDRPFTLHELLYALATAKVETIHIEERELARFFRRHLDTAEL